MSLALAHLRMARVTDLYVKARIDALEAVADAEAANPAGAGKPDYFRMLDALKLAVVAAPKDAQYLDDGYKVCVRPLHPAKGY
jgi:hypothetical protein